jgi:hypothetical protein
MAVSVDRQLVTVNGTTNRGVARHGRHGGAWHLMTADVAQG